jgi:hypothetical protein
MIISSTFRSLLLVDVYDIKEEIHCIRCQEVIGRIELSGARASCIHVISRHFRVKLGLTLHTLPTPHRQP